MLEFYSHSELVHLTLKMLSYPSAVGMTSRLCSENSTGKFECQEKCQKYHLSPWNFTTCCRGAPVSQQEEFHHAVAMGLRSVGLWQYPNPNWEESRHHLCQPRDAGSFEHATLTPTPKPSSNSLGSWVGPLCEAHLPSFFNPMPAPCHSPKKFLFSAKSESPGEPDAILTQDVHEGWGRLSAPPALQLRKKSKKETLKRGT